MFCPVRGALVTGGIVLIAVGVGIGADLGARESPPTDGVPDRVDVRCEPDSVKLAGPAVEPGPDGVRFVVDNASKARLLQVGLVGLDEPAFSVSIAQGEITEASFAIPPGPVSVRCTSAFGTAFHRPAEELIVLDPEGLWTSPDPTCPDLETVQLVAPFVEGDETPGQTARRVVPGLEPSDDVVKPGYPETPWHGDLVVVIRDGVTIGRVTRAQNEGEWNLVVDACPEAALALRSSSEAVALNSSAQTANRTWSTSPSRTSYSLPSTRIFPFALACSIEPVSTRSS